MQSTKADELRENPREHCNPLSSVFFGFTLPTFWKGRKKDLDDSDLYRALKEHKSDFVGCKLIKNWEEECRKAKKLNKTPSLIKATIKTFGWHYMLLGTMLLIMEIGFRTTQPIFLRKMVTAYASTDKDEKNQTSTYLYAMGVVLTNVFAVLFTHPAMLGNMHMGMKVRIAMCGLVYRKALRLSKLSMGQSTTGQMVNLITNDVSRFDNFTIYLHYLWVGPVETVIVTYFMYEQIGYSCFLALAVLLIFFPLQTYLGRKTSALRSKTAFCTDERVRLMNEIVNGIQVIKMYAWEIPFGKLVEFTRVREMRVIRYVNYIKGVTTSFNMFVTRISIFVCLICYVLLGNFLTAEKAFVITAFANVLKTSMTLFFTYAINNLAETMVSFERIQKLLLLDEFDFAAKGQSIKNGMHNQLALVPENGKPVSDSKTSGESNVVLTNFKAKWNSDSNEYHLNDINLTIKPRTLVAIIGPVGAGKSSLIQALLRELPAASGSLAVKGEVSYACQEPWIFTGTVRQNILFGLDMDKKRYNLTVKKCALERDFKLLPYGDKTIVGDRGASLSGGQKARINLARAVYRQADIYLLDDPLSAVDTHVGRHLFDQCMRDYLRSKIVILVTHQLQFLEQADLIVIMDKGKITASGTYASMRQSNLDFVQLLMNSTENEEEDEEEGEMTLSRNGSALIRRNSSMNKSGVLRNRLGSILSKSSIAESMVNDGPTEVEESVELGEISWKMYSKYFSSGGGIFFIFIIILFFIVAQGFVSGADYFLSYWVNKNENELDENGDDSFKSDPVDISIFTVLNVGIVLVTLVRSFLFFNLTKRSSNKLHNAMFLGVTRAAMYFFNTNPLGRILNRFSRDMGQVDEILPIAMMDVFQILLNVLGIMVVLCSINPWYLVPTVILALLFYVLRGFYLKTSRDVKRLEARSRSPIYTHLGASLNGLATIRASGAEQMLIKEFDNYQDAHSSPFYMYLATSRAFGLWLDLCSVIYIAVITFSFFLFRVENAGTVGLAITQAMSITARVQWGMRQSAELDNTMTSVERIAKYEHVESEGALESTPDKKPPVTWPAKGDIKFADLSLRYAPDPDCEPVLKHLNIDIKPTEKVGIVGRTGAGKSSLINALFRLSYNDGAVIIDERDTSDMGLHDLRSKISIIPQEPVLFSGTMRFNLDPFDEYSDIKLWEALDEVKLKQVVCDMANGLESKISEGGSNFSVGQRQLVCLARAILRDNRVLVLDEATANVDPQTDALIQTTIRQKFKACTVLTIAHRLNTVMDSDKVLVMDAGRAVEFGSPYELLTESKAKVFWGMVQQTGNATYDSLFKVAQEAHEKNQLAKKEI